MSFRAALASRSAPAVLTAVGLASVLLGLSLAVTTARGPAAQALCVSWAASGLASLLTGAWQSAPPKGARP